jgi:hypothetical protein
MIAVLKNPIQLLLFGMGVLPVVFYVALVGKKNKAIKVLCARAELRWM